MSNSASGGCSLGEHTFSSRLLGKAPLNILANIELPSCAKPCKSSRSSSVQHDNEARPKAARSDHDDNSRESVGHE